jgi:hypothetical protein
MRGPARRGVSARAQREHVLASTDLEHDLDRHAIGLGVRHSQLEGEALAGFEVHVVEDQAVGRDQDGGLVRLDRGGERPFPARRVDRARIEEAALSHSATKSRTDRPDPDASPERRLPGRLVVGAPARSRFDARMRTPATPSTSSNSPRTEGGMIQSKNAGSREQNASTLVGSSVASRGFATMYRRARSVDCTTYA